MIYILICYIYTIYPGLYIIKRINLINMNSFCLKQLECVNFSFKKPWIKAMIYDWNV